MVHPDDGKCGGVHLVAVAFVRPGELCKVVRAMKSRGLLIAAQCCTIRHMNKIISPPTKPPRVSVPVSAEVLVIFERLAKAGNMSTGRAMAEWLADTVDAAELMASTMERARAAPKIVTAELHAMMLGMTDQTKELMDKFSKMKGPIEGASGKRSAPRPDGPFVGWNPPSCNTGGKLPEQGQPKRGVKKASSIGKFPLPPAKVQAYADTNGKPPKAAK